jgi:hypothetical protein
MPDFAVPYAAPIAAFCELSFQYGVGKVSEVCFTYTRRSSSSELVLVGNATISSRDLLRLLLLPVALISMTHLTGPADRHTKEKNGANLGAYSLSVILCIVSCVFGRGRFRERVDYNTVWR